jgi:hypothetical protein
MNIPPAALPTYERLRAEVLNGQARAEGLTAIAYHGMLRGLTVILTEAAPEMPSPPARLSAALEGMSLDRELLRLLANMVLQSQSKVSHVY